MGEVHYYSREGKINIYESREYDLIEQPEEKTVWLEVFRFTHWQEKASYVISTYSSEEDLNKSVQIKRDSSKWYKLIAIKKITYMEGEGIE